MIRTLRFAAIFVPALALLAAVQGLAHGQTTPAKLYLAPDTVAPGGEIVLSGHGFTPGYLPNFTAFSDTDEYDVGPASADADGQFHIAATLPADMVPNTYTVFTFEGDVPVTTTLTVVPPPTLRLVPALGKPGAVVTYTVTGLVPGSLRLDYAGAPVAGPLAVSGSVYTGTFIVPGDRPIPLGSTAAVTATNIVAGRVVGRAYADFQSQAPSSPPTYNFNNVVITSPGMKAGDPFTATGQIVPPPVGPIGQYKLKALWKTGAGQTFPINAQSTTMQSNGSFQMLGLLPSLFNGDAGSTAPGDQLNLTLSGPGNVVLVGSLFGMPLGPPPAVRLRVVNPQGQPIAGAWVSTAGIGALGLDEDESSAAGPGVATGQLQLNAPNQIATFIDPMQPPGQNPFACSPTAAYGPTDGNGYFEPGLNWDAVLGILGQKLPIGLGPEGEIIYNQVPATGTLTFNVNAWWQGYGTLNSSGQPQLYTRTIEYRKGTNKFHDPATGAILNVNPLTVTLPALPPNTQLNVPIVYTVEGAVPKSGYLVPGYGTFVSFADFAGNPAVTFTNLSPLKVSFKHDPLKFGSLVSVTFSLDGQNKGTFQTIGDPDCAGATNYYFNLTNAHQLSAGWHIAHIQAHAAGGSVTNRFFGLYFAKPPDWFYNASYKNRKVSLWSAGFVDMSGEQLPTGSPGSSSTLGADVPRVGYLDNAAGADSRIWQRIKATGDIQTFHYGGVHSKALNTSAPDQKTNQPAAGNNPITFSSGGPITILDTGWMPLFRDVWGIWPIASATIGADMAFNATLTYNGTLTLQPPASTLFVDPEATVAVDAWFDLSALFGVVSANAHAIPAITVGMPVTFVNGVNDDSDICFRYKLDITWSAKVGVCPLCDKESGTKNIFNDYTPKSALCAPGAQSAARAVSTPPSDASSSLATDGFGHSLSVWSDDAGSLRYSTYNGAAWQVAQTLVADGASLKPKVAYFAPNQAVAVWTHNNLTLQQAQTANITDTVKAQHLRYAEWNGSSWSTPQNLTLPATGEGNVALAGCLSTTPGCPSGGAVTAAWVRDVAGVLSQRQFRLYYATYQNGAWGAVQAVDAASTATDTEPVVVYDAGAPLVVWVRDADRDLGTLTDRRLAYRRLDGVSAVVVPADLPAGIAEPSAA
ncbi:MAG TPA: hypothetical protein VFL17_04350, partial [Anaerolineae bacterium]|nr:hypothetical protein [Anaerolineae bacterium]